MKTRRSNKMLGECGATMIEMLIAALLTAIVAAATMEFYVSQHKSWLMQNEVSEVQQNGRVCLDEMAGALRMGGFGITSHAPFAIGTDSLAVYFVGDSVGDVDTVLYFVSDTQRGNPALYRQPRNGPSEMFGDNIESLTVTALSPRILELGITARSAKPDPDFIGGDGFRRRSFTTRVTLRNM